jgi:hypothetical protein
MRILVNNLINDKASYSATNSNDNYGPESIAHPILTRIFQATANSSVITITLDDVYDINCFFIAYHNLNGISVVFKNAAGGTVDTQTPLYNFDVGSYYFDKISGIKTIVMTINTAETYVRLGGFGCGVYYQLPNGLNQHIRAVENLGSIEYTQSGQSLYQNGANLRAYEMNIPEIKPEFEREIQQQFMFLKRPIFIDSTEDNRDAIAPGYFNVLSIPGMQKNNRRFSTSLIYQESR